MKCREGKELGVISNGDSGNDLLLNLSDYLSTN
jgi:hypothetical protein